MMPAVPHPYHTVHFPESARASTGTLSSLVLVCGLNANQLVEPLLLEDGWPEWTHLQNFFVMSAC